MNQPALQRMQSGHDPAYLSSMITRTIDLAHNEALCRGLTPRLVLSIWARGETVDEQSACLSQLRSLGRGG